MECQHEPKHSDEPTYATCTTNTCTNLHITSYNIEGFRSNKLYLEKIAKRSDIIVIQEHWLHNFEKHELQEFLTDFICLVKCSDDKEPIVPYQRPRGKGGVAICYKTAIGKAVEEKQDGGNRVATIKILAEPKPLLIVGTYMPCRGTKTSESDFIESLDEISEIVCKYEQSCNILLAGDLNAALLKDAPNSRDKKLLSFIDVHSFNNVGHLRKVDTYHHHSGSCSTQIDYIFQNHKNVITRYITFQREAENCSTHDPVHAIVPVVLYFKTEEDDVYTIPHRIN